MRQLLLTILMVLSCIVVYGQRTISGKITDGDTGEGLPGVTIQIKGSSTGTTTDLDGNFSLAAAAEDVLVISYVGFLTQEIAVGNRTVIDVVLSTDVEQLSEVVVIGYGAIQKEDATGSLELATEEDFNRGFQTSPDQLIQGRVPGVQITGASGAPGSKSAIRIRGGTSIRASNDPLIVVDGVPLDGRDTSPGGDIGAGRQPSANPLSFLNPSDIESISILKDASATAIYGSRGANGVLIITTKSGVSGRPQFSYDGSVGISWMPDNRKYNLLSADEFRANAPESQVDDSSVDAFDEILQEGVTQNHAFSYGGATDSGGRYRISLSYQDQEGIIKNTGLERISTNIKISQEAWDGRLKVESSIIASVTDQEQTALSENVGAEGDLMSSAIRWNPTRSFVGDDGSFVQRSDNERNPLAFLEYYSDNSETQRLFANLGVTFSITDDLDFKVNLGGDQSVSERGIALSRLFFSNVTNGGIGQIENLNSSQFLIENTLTYNKTFSNFKLNVVGGYSFQEFFRSGNRMRGEQFIIDTQDDYISNLNYAEVFRPSEQESFEDPDDQLQSYFARANFDILDKFLFTATVRIDGSSRFGEDNEYGTFPAVAAGWRLSEEAFVPEFFNDLKLRAGWGITGNREFPVGVPLDQFEPVGSGPGSGAEQVLIGNPDLQWEETTQTNVGVDYTLLEGRLSGSIDWYFKETDNLLFRLPAVSPAPVGSFFWDNLGVTIENSGWDFGLNYILLDQTDLVVNLGVNASIFNNEIIDDDGELGPGIQTGEINGQGLSQQRGQLLFGGQEVNAFYLGVWEGYDADGNSIYSDLNNDGASTPSNIDAPGTGDRAFVGSPNPDWNLGVNLNVTYKNWDFAMLWSGAFGHQIFDNTALALFSQSALQGGFNVDSRVIEEPQASQDSGDPAVPSTQNLFDADFFRLDNLTLAYNVNTGNINWLTGLRLSVTGQNLLLFTGYDGFDPEVNTNKQIDDVPSFGIDYLSYPRARIVNFGVNVIF